MTDELTPEIVVDLLLLVGIEDEEAAHARVSGWTAAQMEAAADWAAALHVHASDHNNVKVPATPAHVVPLLPRAWREALERRP